MKNRRKISLLISTVLMSLGVALVATPSAIALPDYGYDMIFYSDATHTTVVGTESLACNARHTVTGVRSNFYDIEEFPCGW